MAASTRFPSDNLDLVIGTKNASLTIFVSNLCPDKRISRNNNFFGLFTKYLGKKPETFLAEILTAIEPEK